MRDPSIHIRKSDLEKIVEQKGEELGIAEIRLEEFIRECSKHACNNRTHLTTTKKIKEKVDRTIRATDKVLNRFRTVLIFERQKAGHRNFDDYKHGTKAQMLREVADAALKFCNDFGYTEAKGFQIFSKFMVEKMSRNFKLNKIKYLTGELYNKQEQREFIDEVGEKRVSEAIEFYERFYELEVPEGEEFKLQFATALKMADKFGVDFPGYLKLLKEDFGHFNAVPMPKDLTGEKAEDRLLRVKAKNKSDKDGGTEEEWYKQFKSNVGKSRK